MRAVEMKAQEKEVAMGPSDWKSGRNVEGLAL